jgi:Icc protein
MSDVLLQFVQISDTHLVKAGTRPDYSDVPPDLELYTQQILALPYDARQAAAELVRQVNNLPTRVDFVLHTGDVWNDPDSPDDYRDAKAIFDQFKYPVYYLPGNHDNVSDLQRVLCGRDPSKLFDYDFDSNGVQVVCLDSNGTNPPHSGWLDDSQLQWLNAICTADDHRPLVVALHHHPILIDVPWVDLLAVLNGESLHKILLRARHRLRGVFYGHIHHTVDVMRDGILYSSAPSALNQFVGWPGYKEAELEKEALPGFNLITITADRTYVRRRRYPIP